MKYTDHSGKPSDQTTLVYGWKILGPEELGLQQVKDYSSVSWQIKKEKNKKPLIKVKPRKKYLPAGLRISDSGKSSKFEVSSILFISIDIAAGRSLRNINLD